MEDRKLVIPTNRLEGLADAVFAIAMTLLVLNIAVPQISQSSADALLPEKLLEILPSFYNFALSFLLLGIFWVIHQKQYIVIKRSTSTLAWINIFLLMFVVLVPFTTELMDTYTDNVLAVMIFNINLLVLGVMFYIQYKYCIDNHLLRSDLSGDDVNFALTKNMIIIPVAVLAIVVNFFSPAYSTLAYLMIPVIMRFIKKKKHRIAAVN